MWIFFYVNCLVIGNHYSASCVATPNGVQYKTEKECRDNEIGINQNKHIENGKLIVTKTEFTQGICLHLKKDKVTREVYKIIKEK